MENKITFEDIKKANESIQTMTIERKDKRSGTISKKEYAEVNQRIKAFRMVFPLGCITTEIKSLENGVVTMKATILDGNGDTLGTGYAQEKETSSFINQTSFIENCETSAVGRALGMCGFGIDTSIASYEEVANAMENQNKKTDYQPINDDKAKLLVEIQAFYNSHKEQYGKIIKATINHNKVEKISDLPIEELKGLVDIARSSKNTMEG